VLKLSKVYAIFLTMNTVDITITSKNQITLPADFVRQMKLRKNRVMTVTMLGDSLKLTPRADVSTTMGKYWAKHSAVRTVSDEELKAAVRIGMGGK
jgi:DNA-binding transcriptional regulator/RsmH inhibitor MraZ